MKMTAMLALKKKFDELLDLAKAGKPTEEGADLIYDSMPDEFFPILKTVDWFDQLARYVPEAVPHKEWLLKASAEGLDMFEHPEKYFEEDEDGVEKKLASADAPNTDSKNLQDPPT